MDRINILDEALINKIAAGEVIERPASIIKELLENSLDAKASKISVEVRDGGRSFIRVADNGIGMSKHDAKLSWQRHATSKISSVNDLFSISTLGFRGEALTSIAAVSHLTIITKEEEGLSGIKISVLAGKEESSEEVGCQVGTIIEVKDLFFNTPARKKYMKGADVEYIHILDILTRYAMIYPEVHFRLVKDGKEIMNIPPGDIFSHLSYIYGKAAKEFLPVDFEKHGYKIKGYTSRPSLSKPTKNDQSIYVNRRYIKKNKTINDAINNAYHPMMMVGRYPVTILDMEIPPEKIDVNVHPQKAEIRLQDEKDLYDAVYSAIKEALSVILIPEPEVKQSLSNYAEVIPAMIREEKNGYAVSPDKQTLLEEAKEEVATERLPEMKILGVVNKTYILAEIEGAILLIDQHAAAERILYEKFTAELIQKKVKIQELLTPEIIELTPKQHSIALNNMDTLLALGYKVEDFGKNAILLRSVPIMLSKQLGKSMLLDFLDDPGINKEPLIKLFHARVARMSCRTAIKAGDDITMPQIKEYIQKLDNNNA